MKAAFQTRSSYDLTSFNRTAIKPSAGISTLPNYSLTHVVNNTHHNFTVGGDLDLQKEPLSPLQRTHQFPASTDQTKASSTARPLSTEHNYHADSRSCEISDNDEPVPRRLRFCRHRMLLKQPMQPSPPVNELTLISISTLALMLLGITTKRLHSCQVTGRLLQLGLSVVKPPSTTSAHHSMKAITRTKRTPTLVSTSSSSIILIVVRSLSHYYRTPRRQNVHVANGTKLAHSRDVNQPCHGYKQLRLDYEFKNAVFVANMDHASGEDAEVVPPQKKRRKGRGHLQVKVDATPETSLSLSSAFLLAT